MKHRVPVAAESSTIRLHRLVHHCFRSFNVPGGVAIVVSGGRPTVVLHGRASLSGNRPVTRQTLFNVGSVAKTLVSGAVAALVADGRLRWDSPLVDSVPEFGFPDRRDRGRVSLADCVANRLGLARQGFCEWGASNHLSITELLGRLEHTPRVLPLGAGFSYVNPGHSAAALAVARASGMDFLEFVGRRLLHRADLRGIAGGADARNHGERADCHAFDLAGGRDADRFPAELERSERPRTVPVAPLFADNAVGATGVWMSSEALSDWLRLHLGGGRLGKHAVLPAAMYRRLWMPQVHVPEDEHPFGIGPGECTGVAYGLGWFCTIYRGHRVLRHSGAEIGANAHVALAPEAGAGVAVVTNVATRAADVLGLTLMDALLGLSPLPWTRRAGAHDFASSSAPGLNLRGVRRWDVGPRRYAGVYRHPGNGAARISERGSMLDIRFADAPHFDGLMHPLGGSWFQVRPWNLGVRPAMARPGEITVENGTATAFTLPGLGTWQRV